MEASVGEQRDEAARSEHLYLHVPFCTRRCSYCDFAIAVRRAVPWREYADAVRLECARRAVASRCAPLRTVYLGGGTPSRLGPDGVAAVLDTLREQVFWRSDAEVTLEANPEDITADAVRAWASAGVNRLSIGVQTFDPSVLAWMHRVHTADDARRAVHEARAGGIAAFSLDLIFATPEGMARNWSRDLDAAVALDPDHISLYGLTIEPHTPLGRWHERGTVEEASETRYEREFLHAHDGLEAAGYTHYEVSNYAKPGRRAVHNSAYWRGVPYVGLGPSAHDFDGLHRRWNVEAYAQWDAALRAGRDPLAGSERLTDENRVAETVYLGLRTIDGLLVTRSELPRVNPWVDAGWVTVHPEGSAWRLRCTPHGWLRLDALAADLTAFRSHS